MLEIIKRICEKSNNEKFLSEYNLSYSENEKKIVEFKRPLPQKWNEGDIFSIELSDKSYVYGQILDKRYFTCALFDFRSNMQKIEISSLNKSKPITILHIGPDLINNKTWIVFGNRSVDINPSSGPGGKFGEIGAISFGGGWIFNKIAEGYFALKYWNDPEYYEPDYFDKFLLKNVKKPSSLKYMSSAEREKYRLEKGLPIKK